MERKTEIVPAVAPLALLGLKIRETAFSGYFKEFTPHEAEYLVRFFIF